MDSVLQLQSENSCSHVPLLETNRKRVVASWFKSSCSLEESSEKKDGSERYLNLAFLYTMPQNLCCVVLVCLYMYLFLFFLLFWSFLPQHIYQPTCNYDYSISYLSNWQWYCIADIYRIIIQCTNKEWHHTPTSSSLKKRKHTHTQNNF